MTVDHQTGGIQMIIDNGAIVECKRLYIRRICNIYGVCINENGEWGEELLHCYDSNRDAWRAMNHIKKQITNGEQLISIPNQYELNKEDNND